MNEDKPVVYDPNPLDFELKILGDLSKNQLNPEDLVKPENVRFLVYNQQNAILRLKVAEKQIVNLNLENKNLTEDREKLRIKMAARQEWQKITWLEIPISFLGGFAINKLSINTSDSLGWVLLVLSIIMLFILRGVNISGKSKNKPIEEEK